MARGDNEGWDDPNIWPTDSGEGPAMPGPTGATVDETPPDGLPALEATAPQGEPGLDVAKLRRAVESVNDADSAEWLEHGDFVDAVAAAYDQGETT